MLAFPSLVVAIAAVTVACYPCLTPISPEGDTLIGQPCDRPYVVAIPTPDPGSLEKLQQAIPTAFITYSHLGWYIQAGAADHPQKAEILNLQLRLLGWDSRVIYRPVPCSPRQ